MPHQQKIFHPDSVGSFSILVGLFKRNRIFLFPLALYCEYVVFRGIPRKITALPQQDTTAETTGIGRKTEPNFVGNHRNHCNKSAKPNQRTNETAAIGEPPGQRWFQQNKRFATLTMRFYASANGITTGKWLMRAMRTNPQLAVRSATNGAVLRVDAGLPNRIRAASLIPVGCFRFGVGPITRSHLIKALKTSKIGEIHIYEIASI